MATRIVARHCFGNGDYYDPEGGINDCRYPREINEYYASNPSAIGNWAGSFEKGVTIAAAAFGSIIRGTNKSLRKEWEDVYHEIFQQLRAMHMCLTCE